MLVLRTTQASLSARRHALGDAERVFSQLLPLQSPVLVVIFPASLKRPWRLLVFFYHFSREGNGWYHSPLVHVKRFDRD